MRTFLFFFFTLWLTQAPAISRVGNGTTVTTQQFQVSAPMEFYNIDLFPTIEGARFSSLTPLFMKPKTFDLRNFTSEFPDLKSASLAEVDQVLLGQEWKPQVVAHGCPRIYRQDTTTATAFLVIWGPGQGFVLVGSNHPTVVSAIETTLQSLELKPGLCP